MGLAITGMHYTAMQSTYCFAGGATTAVEAALEPTLFGIVVAMIVGVIIALAIFGVWIDRILMKLNDLVLVFKFPLVIVAVSLLTGLATGITAHTKFSTQLEIFAKEQLVALRESRQASLENYLGSIRQDLDMLASSLLVEKAMVNFTSAWYEIGDNPGGQLGKLYIDDNPHPAGKKADLYNARDGSKYSIRHGFYHRWFRKFLEDRGYYDIFLFTPAGDLIYTVTKEADYATNFQAGGPWADTGLGEVYRAVNDNPTPGFQTFTDFQAYGPSNDAPASFIAQPVFDGGGTYLGVLAMQMPIGRINRVMQVSAGLGETGEAYMVGADLLMRSDSKFVSDSTILETKVDTEPARKALAGETGVEVVPEHRGMAMVSAFGPLEFMGVRWAVIAEIGQAELLAPVAETGRFMIVAVAVILVLVTAVGIVLARGMSRPIVEMTRNMRRLAAGDLDVEIGSTDRTDEIGEMAAALDVFKENAIKRQKAEQELEEKEAQLRITMENMPGGMFMVDNDLVIQVYNEQYKEMYELPDEAVHAGGPLRDAVKYRAERGDYGPGNPEDLVEQRMRGYIDRMTLRHEEQLSNGRVIELMRTPVEGGGVVGIATDITDRKRAEEELAEKEAQLRAFIENAPAYIYMKDLEGRYVLVNKHVEAALNRPKSDIIGKTNADFYPASLARKYDEHDQHIVATGEADAQELDITIADGTTRPHLIVKFPIFDAGGNISGVGSYATDITDRKRAEEALRESETLFKQAAGMSRLGHWAYDETTNRLTHCSDELARMHGVTVEEFLAGFSIDDDEMALIHPDDRAEFGALIADVHANAKSYDAVYRALRPDGTIRDVREVGQPMVDDAGAFVRMIGTSQDITEQKRAEREIVAKEVQLRVALDNMRGGIKLVDRDLNYGLFNSRYSELYDFPDGLIEVGRSMLDELRFQAERGDYEPGDAAEAMEKVIAFYRKGEPASWQRTLKTGRTVEFHLAPTPEGGCVNILTDITERKKAENALAAKEAQLRAALDNMPGGMFMVDENLMIQVYNDQYKEIYDLPDEAVQEGVSLAEAVRVRAERGDYGPGDPVDLIEQRMQGYIERMTLRHEERLPNGRIIELLRTPVEGGGVVGIATDITERKEAEDALREKSAIVELLHKTAADANQARDVDEAMRGCLDTVCAHTGWPVGHVYVRAAETPDVLVPTDIWHFDDPKRFATFRRVTKKARFEAGVGLPGRVLESGKPAWIVDVTEDPNFPRAKQAKDIGVKAGFAIPVLVAGRVEAVFEFFAAEAFEPDEALLDLLDNVGSQIGRVIERKRAEEELRANQKQLQALADNLPDFISMTDYEGRYIFVNKRFEEWVCLGRDDIVGKSVHDLYPEERANEIVAFDQRAIAAREVLSDEIVDTYPDGKTRTVIRTRFPVVTSQGRAEQFTLDI